MRASIERERSPIRSLLTTTTEILRGIIHQSICICAGCLALLFQKPATGPACCFLQNPRFSFFPHLLNPALSRSCPQGLSSAVQEYRCYCQVFLANSTYRQ